MTAGRGRRRPVLGSGHGHRLPTCVPRSCSAPPRWPRVLVLSPTLWRPTRHVVTIAHEGAHGLVALAAGRRLSGIRLHSDTSGLTVSAGQAQRSGMVLTCAAGYTGPALFGLGAAALLAPGTPSGCCGRCSLLLALLLVQIRNWYGLWSVLVTGAVVFGATWWLPPRVRRPSPRWPPGSCSWPPRGPVLELQSSRRRRRAPDSDADQLAGLTPFPALVWVGVFLLVDVGALLLGGLLALLA